MRSLGSEENIMHLLQHSCSCSPYHVVAVGELECVFGKEIMFIIWFNAFERFNERYVNHCFHFACRNPVLRQPIIWSILNAIPTSSAVSRKAVASNVPSLSTYLPPGKDISPLCDFRLELRFVRNTWGLSL